MRQRDVHLEGVGQWHLRTHTWGPFEAVEEDVDIEAMTVVVGYM